MNDFDIVISLNPAQPVAGAAKVTAAVAKIEHQSKETQKAIDAVTLQTKQAQDAMAGIAEKQNAKIKQGVAAAAAAFSVLNEKLKLTESAFGRTIVEASKFASIGAQVGGAWGAGIGATIAVADGLGTALGITISKAGKLGEEFDKLAEKQKKAGISVVDLTKAVDAAGKSLVEYAQYASAVNRITHSMAEGFKGVADAAASVPDWLMRVGLGYDPWDPGKTKKKLDKINAPPKERQYFNGLSPLDFAAGPQRTPYMGLGERADGGTGPYAVNVTEQYDLMGIAQAQLEKNNEQVVLLAQNTRKWNEELAASDTVLIAVADGIKQAGASFVDTLVEGAFGADVSWKKWGEDMLKMFAKLILQASLLRATGSPAGGVGGTATGLYKLLGFASGGVIGPRGGGAADTETAMFRVAPRETIRIHTPEQEAAYARGGGGPAVNIVNTPVDDRALLQALSGPSGAQTVMNVVRSNRRAIKALLDG